MGLGRFFTTAVFGSVLWLPSTTLAGGGIKGMWPGSYLSAKSSAGTQVVYYFAANGNMAMVGFVNGRQAGMGQGKCRMRSRNFSCDYLDKSTGQVVTTKVFTPGDNYTSVKPSGGDKACKISKAEGDRVLKGGHVRGCR